MPVVSNLESVEAFLLIAALVAILARRLRLPYTVGLLAAGILVAFSPWKPPFEITKDLVFTLFLPPLVFEAAFLLRWEELRRDLPPLLTMATVGVVLSTAVVFLGLNRLLGWDWRPSLMFATLISATDPVSVIAMLKEARVTGRFRLLIEAESLFNDGAAAALFVIASILVTKGIDVGTASFAFLQISLGGIVSGAVVGAIAVFLMGRTDDHLVETTCTVLAAYGAFLFAEHFGFSGVLAVVVAGIFVGNVGPLGPLSAKGRDDAETFWEFGAFVVNSLLFLLMGSKIAQKDYVPLLLPAVAAVVLVTAGRAVSVYGTLAFFSRSKYAVAPNSQHLLVWGGMRGALSLALALGLPRDLPMRGEVVSLTFAVVAYSTVVQGMTMAPLMRRLLPCAPEPVTASGALESET